MLTLSPRATFRPRFATRSTTSSSSRPRTGRPASACPSSRSRARYAVAAFLTCKYRTHRTRPLTHTSSFAGRRVGRGSLRCAPDAARAVRGRVAHADEFAQVCARIFNLCTCSMHDSSHEHDVAWNNHRRCCHHDKRVRALGLTTSLSLSGSTAIASCVVAWL